ncbi:MAG TPA: hypothetical protein VE570_12005 [Thermoleophilaceae bacterium]|nr:hypothetical protein [Thermoleophilaceae bacterium]
MLYGDCIARGEREIRNILGPDGVQYDKNDLYLDLPPNKGDLEDHFKATQDALGFGRSRIDETRPASDDQWHRVYASSRVYWYRGGGYGRATGTTKSLQYWTYWTYNYLHGGPGIGLVGKHESDLEMVAVVFNADNEPVWVYMSRHGNSLNKEARRFSWGDDRLIRIDGRDDGRPHPVAFAARGSHAMYHRDGEFSRPFPLPNDNFTKDTDRWLLFGGQRSDPDERMKLINLARAPWACWGGRLGQGGGGTDFSDAPQAPLWQQSVFGGDRLPCVSARPTAAAATAKRRSAGGRNASTSEARARAAVRTGDPLVNEFASCDSWYEAPEQPGLTVVACDQAQLDHFIASQLTDPGPGGATLRGPAGADSSGVPTVYADDDPGRLAGVRVTGSGRATGVYVGQMGWDGSLLEATFPSVALPDGEAVRLRRAGETMQLLGRDGRILEEVALQTTKFNSFTRIQPARGVRVATHGGNRATVSWRARRGLAYHVNAAPTPGMNTRLPIQVKPRRSGRVSVRIRLEPSDRWIAVTAFRASARSPAVEVRIPRRTRLRAHHKHRATTR